MYPPPEIIETEVYARMPEALHATGRQSKWLANRGAGPAHSFLEGPAFDRAGNFYCVDLAHGRIFRIAPDRTWTVFADYDGMPNGLKIHKDGRIFVADHEHGVLAFDPATGERSVVCKGVGGEPFKGLNDLSFGADGALYMTDQGLTGFHDMTGAVYRLRGATLDKVCGGLASPNGVVMNRDETAVHVSLTRPNQVITTPLQKDKYGHPRTRMFIQLSGSPIGPDGMAVDEADNLAVVHAGFGTVWVFSPFGEPLWRIRSCAGLRTTNVAYGDADRRSIFVTEAEQGVILKARLPVPGKLVFGLS